MLFKDLIDETINRLAGFSTDSNIRSRVSTIINDKYKFIAESEHWRALQKRQEIRVIPKVTTGTASITKGNRAVTISGLTLVSAYQGRFFKHDNGTREYKINYVDIAGSQLILESPIAEDSSSSVGLEIRKRFYTLNSNTRVIYAMDNNRSRFNNNYVQDTIARSDSSNPFQRYPFTEAGTDEYLTTYETGTVALTKDSNIATGTGTAWLGNVTPGAILKIESKTFRVKRVETDTRIVLHNYSSVNISGTYTIDEDNPRQVEVLFDVGDEDSDDIILPIDTISYVYPLIYEEKDTTELGEPFRETIIAFAKAEYLSDKADQRATSGAAFNIAQALLEGLKTNVDLIATSYKQFHPTIASGHGRGEA